MTILASKTTLPKNMASWKQYVFHLLSKQSKKNAAAYRAKFKKSIIFWKKKGGSLDDKTIATLQDLGIKIEIVGKSPRSKDKMLVRLNQKTPDETTSSILAKTPSWKRMAMCILKKDVECSYMGF